MKNKLIDSILKQLTLEEKINMIHGTGLFHNGGVERLNIPPLKMTDGSRGVRAEIHDDNWNPIGLSDDYVTYLPSGSALASTWNKKLAYSYGKVLGAETRGRGKDVILGPSINIIRSPLCGRNFEYLSEDPTLTSNMALPIVKGIQHFDVASCLKHYAVNNQETERLSVNVKVDLKTLHNIYLKAFKNIVQKGKVLSLMGAYNKVNGRHASQDPYLLNKVLRDQWKFNNMVISDWSAVNNTLEAANSGIDIEMSVTNNFDQYFMALPLLEKIKAGEISESLIDQKVSNILTVMNKIHLIGDTDKRKRGYYNTKKHQKIAYDVAKEAIVLLKNENNILPLSKNIKRILVIGDNAERLHAKGGGSAEIKSLYEISPLLALKSKYGSFIQIDFKRGYEATPLTPLDGNWQEASLETKEELRTTLSEETKKRQKALRKEALEHARNYDHILFFGGLNHDYDVEGQDRPNLDLPYEQDILIQELLDINPNTIIHITSASAFTMTSWISKCRALLWSGFNGMEGGNALIDVIFGDVNPSGKLTQTFAYSLTDYSSHSIGEFGHPKEVWYKEGEDVGYRHFMKHQIKPVFPFGFGCSYTSFEILPVNYEKIDNKHYFHISIKNTGILDGQEVIQLYAYQSLDSFKVPILKTFDKIMVKKGEVKKVSLVLSNDDFLTYDEALEKDVIAHGIYTIGVGNYIQNLIYPWEISI